MLPAVEEVLKRQDAEQGSTADTYGRGATGTSALHIHRLLYCTYSDPRCVAPSMCGYTTINSTQRFEHCVYTRLIKCFLRVITVKDLFYERGQDRSVNRHEWNK